MAIQSEELADRWNRNNALVSSQSIPCMVSLSSYADEVGPTTIIIVGFLLFVFPEPATSALGAGLMLFGVAYWFWEWNRA